MILPVDEVVFGSSKIVYRVVRYDSQNITVETSGNEYTLNWGRAQTLGIKQAGGVMKLKLGDLVSHVDNSHWIGMVARSPQLDSSMDYYGKPFLTDVNPSGSRIPFRGQEQMDSDTSRVFVDWTQGLRTGGGWYLISNIEHVNKIRKYSVRMSVVVDVELACEDGVRAAALATDIVLGGLNSVDGMHAKEIIPSIVTTNDDRESPFD